MMTSSSLMLQTRNQILKMILKTHQILHPQENIDEMTLMLMRMISSTPHQLHWKSWCKMRTLCHWLWMMGFWFTDRHAHVMNPNDSPLAVLNQTGIGQDLQVSPPISNSSMHVLLRWHWKLTVPDAIPLPSYLLPWACDHSCTWRMPQFSKHG